MKFTPEFIQKVKAESNILQIVGEHVVLKKQGANYVGLCPFHAERSPSFSVSEQKQLYHCYGCKQGGDIVHFMMELHGLSFSEAVEELADRARVKIPEEFRRGGSESEGASNRAELQTAWKLNRFAAKFFRDELTHSASGLKYLETRRTSVDLSEAFYLGLAPRGWEGLSKYLSQAKAPLELAQSLGLVRQGDRGYFDLFRDRLMFPLVDLRGKVVGFGGRKLPEDTSDGPKYLNSPESFLYSKSKYLYGLYQAQKHIREQDTAILVEGYFDVLALHGHGFPHAVAASGTALSSEHLRLLRKFCSRLIVLFDGDRAGQDAMERAMTTGLKEGWILEGAKLPQGLDPDELTRQSPEELRKILESARPLLDSKLEELAEEIRQNPTSESRVRALKQASEYLRELQDPLGQEVRTAWIAENFGIDRRTIQNAMGVGMLQVVGTKGILAGAPKTLAPQGSPSRSSQRQKSREKLSRRERWLLWGVLKGGEMSRSLERAMELGLPPSAELESLFVHSETREWLRRWRKRAESSSSEEMSPGIKKKGPNLGILSKITALLQSSSDEVLNGVEDAEMRAILTQGLLGGEVAGTPSSQELYAAGVEAVRQVWARFSQHLKKKLQEAEAIGDPDRRASAMKDYLDVQRKLKDFNDSSEIHYD